MTESPWGFRLTLVVVFSCAAGSIFAEDAYDAFNRFCLDNFGAQREPLVYETFGKELRTVPEGSWMHVSENSACIAWETHLPAKSYVEYGETDRFGSRTPETERFFYLHTYYLRNLDPGKIYRYRLVCVDERANRITLQDATFTFETKKIAGAIYIPGDMGGPPYRLDKAGATYILTKDVVSESTAFDIAAKNVTLDLNGFTATYNNVAGAKDPRPASAGGGNQSEHGVTVGYNSPGVRILNGTIHQGEGAEGLDRNYPGGSWFQPVYACDGAEIAGLTLDYSGPQVGGIRSGVAEVHHNVIVDRGMEVLNRHQGVDAIMAGLAKTVHHDLIKRCRQRGIAGGIELYSNEIDIDSCATNSFGIFYWGGKDRICRNNRVLGTGYLAIGIGTIGPPTSPCENIKVHDNFVHMQAVAPLARWKEYGEQSGAYCIRIHHSVVDTEYSNNLLVCDSRDGGLIRGVWYVPYEGQKNVCVRDNVIKAISEDEKSQKYGALVVCGADWKPGFPLSVMRNNRVISNFCHVRLSEEYGMGTNAQFIGNVFERVGSRADYRAVHVGFWTFRTTGSTFIDTVFKGDAGFDKVVWEGEGERDFSVGWTLTVKTLPGAKVTVTDREGKTVFSGAADDKGVASAPVLQFRMAAAAKAIAATRTELTPHKVTVEKDGGTATKSLEMDAKKEIRITP